MFKILAVDTMKNNKLAKGFGKYLFGGIAWSALSIFLAWFLIDSLKMYAYTSSMIIATLGIVIRFYFYVLVKLIKKEFLKFVSTEVLFSLLTVLSMTITIDIMKVPTLTATPFIIAGVFILKFIGYLKRNMVYL